jgi:DNA-binding LacI/PurR family transcriptional regulator
MYGQTACRMIAGGNWWRANEIVIRHLTRRTATRDHSRDKTRSSVIGVFSPRRQPRAQKPSTISALTLWRAARSFLGLDRRPTGVVCCSDERAIGFIKTVTGAGLAVPDEVSVVGYDGIEFADYCEPTLTTIRQPRRELGIAGARALLASLRDLPRAGVNPIVLRGELLVRDSTGSAAEESKAVVAR